MTGESVKVARPVWATPAPWRIDKMEQQQEALALLFGPGLQLAERCRAFVIYTPGRICDCLACAKELDRLLGTTEGFDNGISPAFASMFLCPKCGTSSCPRAWNHTHTCEMDTDPTEGGGDAT